MFNYYFITRVNFQIVKYLKFKFCGADRVRTCDLFRARELLSQLSYSPKLNGGPTWTRTTDLILIRDAL